MLRLGGLIDAQVLWSKVRKTRLKSQRRVTTSEVWWIL